MKIIIAGYGFVGKAVHNAIKINYDCIIVDPKHNTNNIKSHTDASGLIICVPTPSLPNGDCNGKHVFDVLNQIDFSIPVLIKSTITPHMAENIKKSYSHLSISFSPEFLRADTANEDFINQKYMIISGEDPEGFWHELFSKTLPFCKNFYQCSLLEATLIKYAENSFLATKVSFFNGLYDLCERNGANFEVVRDLLTKDNRIGSSHSLVPGPDGQRGFGGHCFPKDTAAFINYCKGLGINQEVLEAAVEYNKKVRK